MTVFWVGQRVRFVKSRCQAGQRLIGAVCRVIEVGRTLARFNGEVITCDMIIQHEGNRKLGAVHAWQVEPIVDDHQPCESEFKDSLDRMLEKFVEVVR